MFDTCFGISFYGRVDNGEYKQAATAAAAVVVAVAVAVPATSIAVATATTAAAIALSCVPMTLFLSRPCDSLNLEQI